MSRVRDAKAESPRPSNGCPLLFLLLLALFLLASTLTSTGISEDISARNRRNVGRSASSPKSPVRGCSISASASSVHTSRSTSSKSLSMRRPGSTSYRAHSRSTALSKKLRTRKAPQRVRAAAPLWGRKTPVRWTLR
jgi:hypothetical protein